MKNISLYLNRTIFEADLLTILTSFKSFEKSPEKIFRRFYES